MSSYSLPVIPLTSLTFSGTPPDMQAVYGGGWYSLNWTYPPSTFTYDTSGAQTVTVDDDDGFLQDDPLWGGNSGSESWGPHNQTLSAPLTIGGKTWPAGTVIEDEYEVLVADADGNEYVIAFISMTTNGGATTEVVGFVFDGPAPPPGTALSVIRPLDTQKLDPGKATICFTSGTLIDTPSGPQKIERLAVGDMVMTRDHGAQPLRWIGARHVNADALCENPKLRPIRIAAGAFGAGLPASALTVSPQHRMLVSSRIAERMFGASDVLIPARNLMALEGVAEVQDLSGITYFHLLFDRHELVLANGAYAESLYTGPEAMKAISPAAREEILTLFPELADPDFAPEPVRPLIHGQRARKLAERHMNNRQPLVR